MPWQREMTWRRIDERGQERCIMVCAAELCAMEGLGAVAINGSGLVFEYRIQLTPNWEVQQVTIVAHLGGEEFTLTLEHRSEAGWFANGERAIELDACTDVDFSFSPSTNTVAIKRLSLAVGEEGTSVAVYVTEPELKIGVLEQRYRRIDDRRYEYRAADFTAVIEVDQDSLVTDYPELFEAAALEAVPG